MRRLFVILAAAGAFVGLSLDVRAQGDGGYKRS
jgi:hypothetical protein